MSEQRLHELLERASDVEPRDLIPAAVRGATRRRTHRRAAATAGGALALVLVLVLPFALDSRPAVQEPAQVPTPTSDLSPSAPGIPGSYDATQDLWDPSAAARLPRGRSVLEPELTAPSDAPSLLERPLPGGAVLAWPAGASDQSILGVDGAWRSVPGTARPPGTSTVRVGPVVLSPSGDRLAHPARDGISVVDVTTGSQRTVPWPAALAPPWDSAPTLRWLPGESGLLAQTWDQRWVLPLDGAPERLTDAAPLDEGVAVDPVAGLMVVRGPAGRRELVADPGPRERVLVSDFGWWSGRSEYVARDGLLGWVGGASGEPGRGGPFVLDTATGDIVGHAPFQDPDASLAEGLVRALGFLDRETLLLSVGPTGRTSAETTYLITWHWPDGDLTRVSTLRGAAGDLSVAAEVLAAR